jgi:hypothetical protein
MREEERYHNRLILVLSCLFAILPFSVYGADLRIGSTVATTGNWTATGTVTASSFSGDGSGLSNITAARWRVGNVAVVAKSGGDYTDPFTAMTQLSAWCPSPSEATPCLLKIMPGVYEIGSNSVNMHSYVDIEGSGENVTKITGNITSNGSDGLGVVRGASNSELRSLTVENANATGVFAYAVAIFNSGTSAQITNVTARSQSTGTGFSFGILNYHAAAYLLNVKAYGGGASGINRGIHNSDSSLEMTNGEARGGDGGLYSDGMRNEHSTTFLKNATILALTAVLGSYGLSNGTTNTYNNVTAINSEFYGNSGAILNEAGGRVWVHSSEVNGGVNNSGTLKCVSAYNGGFYLLNSTCQ